MMTMIVMRWMNWQPPHSGYGLALDRPWFVNPHDDKELDVGNVLDAI